jgi:hypothetical protein
MTRLIFPAAMALAVALAGCGGRDAVTDLAFDWPAQDLDAGGWRYLRQPHMDRSVWFCIDPAQCTWQRLGELTGLDPDEHAWWAQHGDGSRALETTPQLGVRYTLPNRVHIAMGDASIQLPIAYVPYLGSTFHWLLDFPEAAWAVITRPIGRAFAFRPGRPRAEGYKVTTHARVDPAGLGGIIVAPDTYAIVFYGHGNNQGLSTRGRFHSEMVSTLTIRHHQHHLLARTVLNSCLSDNVAEQITSSTGTAKGHQGHHAPPIGMLFW